MRYDPETQTLYNSQAEAKILGLPKVRRLPRPDVKPGETATQNAMPHEESGEWVLGWTIDRKTVEETRADLHRLAKSAYSRAMAPIAAQYPPEEREGWQEQVAAAQEVLAGGQNNLIDALRAPTGETAVEMAQAIITKRQQYLTAYGQVTAARRGLSAQIEAATTLAELDSINIDAVFGL